jgi:DNA-binding FrmR family transcriptional regulator
VPERGYTASKEQLNKRLARIEGQVRGVSRMVAEDRYCIDVLTQISAIQAALDKVALGLLDGHTRHCLIGEGSKEASAEELMGAVGGLMQRNGNGLRFASAAGEAPGYAAGKEQLDERLGHVEEQVRTVAGMVRDDRYCIDVLTEISTAQAELDSVSLGLLDGHTRHCLVGGASKDASADELMSAVGRLMRRG